MARVKTPSGCCVVFTGFPENTRRESNVVFIFDQSRRRWPNIKTALSQRLVFTGLGLLAWGHNITVMFCDLRACQRLLNKTTWPADFENL